MKPARAKIQAIIQMRLTTTKRQRMTRFKPRSFGKRKPFCLHYSACLSTAAHENVDLDCRGCERFLHQDIPFDLMEIRACQNLLQAIFNQPVNIEPDRQNFSRSSWEPNRRGDRKDEGYEEE